MSDAEKESLIHEKGRKHMIQDISPSKMDISYKEKTPSGDSVFMVFREGKILTARGESEIRFPDPKDVGLKDTVYLFSVDDADYFLLNNGPAELKGFEYQSMRELRKRKPENTTALFAAFTAYHLSVWYDANRFCGHCGSALTRDTVERAMVCPDCGNRVYPRINPAVIIGIRNGDRILITRYRTGYAHNALVAGFTEIGETLEDTVRREVMEEVGVKVKNITYYKSQPWGMAQDLLMGFFCELDGDETIRMDEGELKYAEWVTREELELQPGDISLTNEMMKVFKYNRGNQIEWIPAQRMDIPNGHG